MHSTCPRRAGVLGAVAAAGDAPAALVRHADGCASCRALAEEARSATAVGELDCDAAEVLIAELDDERTLVAAELGALLAHLGWCACCRGGLWSDGVAADDTTLEAGAETALAGAPLPTVAHDLYRVEVELARGGMGKVSRAVDLRLGRAVALKEPLPREAPGAVAALTDGWARLEREARLAGRLTHPGIVSVYEAGRWATGAPFCAMQLVAGRSLDKVIAAAADGAARLALLPHAAAVADALAYAHSHRVIHRDLKPQNVIVGEFGETVVIDWGLAKELDAGGAEAEPPAGPYRSGPAGLTHHGQALGTPAYMPPEQARGEPVDERADVYAIGALTYHLLAGRPPYAGADPAETLRAVLSAAPAPLSSAAPAAPRELRAIVDKAMARRPADRYPSARELAEDLRRFTAGQLVGAHAYSLIGLVRHWLRHRRVPVTVALLLAAVLAATLVVSVSRVVAARDRARRALVEVERRNTDLLLARARQALERDPTEAVAWLAQVPVDERSFGETRALLADALARGVAESQLEAHAGVPRQVAIDPRGLLVATSDDRGEVRLWQPARGEGRVLARHRGEAFELAFDGSGRRLAVVGEGGAQILTLDGDGGEAAAPRWLAGSDAVAPLWTCAFVKGGRELVTGGADGTVRAWPLDGGAPRLLWGTPLPPGSPPRFTQTLVSPSLELIFVIDQDGTVAAIDHDGRERWRAAHPGGMALSWALSPDARSVATWAEDGVVRVWRLADGDSRALGEIERAGTLAWSPDGERVAAGSRLKLARVWRLDGGPMQELTGHDVGVLAIRFSVDGKQVITGGEDATARVWSLDGDEQWRLRGHRAAVYQLAAMPDGRLLTVARDGSARVWRPRRRPTRTLRGHGAAIYRVWLSADGQTVISAGRDGSVRVFDAGGWERRRLDGVDGGARELFVTPDGDWLVTRAGDGRCLLWPTAGGAAIELGERGTCDRGADVGAGGEVVLTVGGDGAARLWRRDGHRVAAVALAAPATRLGRLAAGGDAAAALLLGEDGRLRRVAAEAAAASVEVGALPPAERMLTDWSSQGTRVAVVDGDRLLWLDTGGASGRVRLPLAEATRLRLSADGRLAAVATARGPVLVVALDGGGAVTRLDGHSNAVLVARFAPGGRRLVTAAEGELYLWDLDSGERRELSGGARLTNAIVFSEDGRQLASVGVDEQVRLWAEELASTLPATPAETAAAVRAGAPKGMSLGLDSPGRALYEDHLR